MKTSSLAHIKDFCEKNWHTFTDFKKKSINYQIPTKDIFCLKNVKITNKKIGCIAYVLRWDSTRGDGIFWRSFTYLSFLLCFCHATVKKLWPSSLGEVRPKDGGGLIRMRSPACPPRTPNFSDAPILNPYLLLTKLSCLPLVPKPY
jgi:hypothetical protein